MKLRLLFTALALAMLTATAYAEEDEGGHGGHAGDVEFGYDNLANPSAFVIEHDEYTTEGYLFFESEMEELDPFNSGDYSSDEPGFTTASAEGMLVNENDQIWLQTLDASAHSSFGVGYVNFYNPVTDSLEAAGRMGIYDNSSSTDDLILSGGSVESGLNPQFLGLGDDHGDVHDHLIVDLLDDASAPNGAYGLLFTMQADFATGDGNMDLDSDPFWIIWNHGMSDDDFDDLALAKFGVSAVPEPTSFCVFALGTAALVLRRRKRA